MTSDPQHRPPFTLDGVAEGIRLVMPAVPGSVVFAAAFGSVAAQKGLGFPEAMLMSATVFAGISQLVAMEVWTDRWTIGAVLTVCLVTAIVNMRLVLMSASLRPWLARLPAHVVYPSFLTLTDVNWIVAMRAREAGRDDLGILVGAGTFLWLMWVFGTAPGYLVGALVPDPTRFGLDLVMPSFLTAMLVALWKGRRQTLLWAIAGSAALATAAVLPGYWFIIAGSLAGAVAGALIDE